MFCLLSETVARSNAGALQRSARVRAGGRPATAFTAHPLKMAVGPA
ncbi:hypothetical protein L810_2362 [Burkholderia sp. AU4i]|nr:hypothetical protein L810_2362 [Burkholderia sp. AU4i]MDW9250024.1 hypothetical protein [Burkholderia cepacia]